MDTVSAVESYQEYCWDTLMSSGVVIRRCNILEQIHFKLDNRIILSVLSLRGILLDFDVHER